MSDLSEQYTDYLEARRRFDELVPIFNPLYLIKLADQPGYLITTQRTGEHVLVKREGDGAWIAHNVPSH